MPQTPLAPLSHPVHQLHSAAFPTNFVPQRFRLSNHFAFWHRQLINS